MKIFIGSDHRGFELKEHLKPWLTALGHEVIDCGNSSYDKDDDFPDFSFLVADKVAETSDSRGIVMCGSGIGVTVAANKVKGIRCSTSHSVEEVKHGRLHDDMNVLALSADYMNRDLVIEMITVFLNTPFDTEDRYTRRLKKISDREATWGK